MLAGKCTQRIDQTEIHRQLADGCRFPSRDNQAEQAIEVRCQAHLDGHDADALQDGAVFGKIPL